MTYVLTAAAPLRKCCCRAGSCRRCRRGGQAGAPIVDGLAEVRAFDPLAARQIRDGPRDAKNSVQRSSGEVEAFDGPLDHALAVGPESAAQGHSGGIEQRVAQALPAELA